MPDNNQTKGCIAVDKIFIGLATCLAIFSARIKPNFFGINSPKMIDKKVTMITTMVVATVSEGAREIIEDKMGFEMPELVELTRPVAKKRKKH